MDERLTTIGKLDVDWFFCTCARQKLKVPPFAKLICHRKPKVIIKQHNLFLVQKLY